MRPSIVCFSLLAVFCAGTALGVDKKIVSPPTPNQAGITVKAS